MAKKQTTIDWIAYVLLCVGGLSIGLVGLLKFDLLDTIFGKIPTLLKIVQILIGIAAVYIFYMKVKK